MPDQPPTTLPSELLSVEIILVRGNPLRNLDRAPLDETRILWLKSQYESFGHFQYPPMARAIQNDPVADYELGFGDEQLEAAVRSEHTHFEIRVTSLDDDQMMKLMPIESGAHARRDFLLCFAAYEALVTQHAKNFRSGEISTTEIGRWLGWVYKDGKREKTRLDQMLKACSVAYEAISKGEITFDQLIKRVRHSGTGLIAPSAVLGYLGNLKTHELPAKQRDRKWLVGIRPGRSRITRNDTLNEARPFNFDKEAKPHPDYLQPAFEDLRMLLARSYNETYAKKVAKEETDNPALHLFDLIGSVNSLGSENVHELQRVLTELELLIGRVSEAHKRLSSVAENWPIVDGDDFVSDEEYEETKRQDEAEADRKRSSYRRDFRSRFGQRVKTEADGGDNDEADGGEKTEADNQNESDNVPWKAKVEEARDKLRRKHGLPPDSTAEEELAAELARKAETKAKRSAAGRRRYNRDPDGFMKGLMKRRESP